MFPTVLLVVRRKKYAKIKIPPFQAVKVLSALQVVRLSSGRNVRGSLLICSSPDGLNGLHRKPEGGVPLWKF